MLTPLTPNNLPTKLSKTTNQKRLGPNRSNTDLSQQMQHVFPCSLWCTLPSQNVLLLEFEGLQTALAPAANAAVVYFKESTNYLAEVPKDIEGKEYLPKGS